MDSASATRRLSGEATIIPARVIATRVTMVAVRQEWMG